MPDTQSMPPAGPVTPHLVVSDAKAAIAFYERAFGAAKLYRLDAPDGRVLHASVGINGGIIFLCDDFPEYAGGKKGTPDALGGSPVSIHLHVADADALFNRAVAAGAVVTMPLADQFWGDRFGKLRDPFGHEWSIAATIRTVSEEDMRRAADAFAAPAGSGADGI